VALAWLAGASVPVGAADVSPDRPTFRGGRLNRA
jgi:hypothetical protein